MFKIRWQKNPSDFCPACSMALSLCLPSEGIQLIDNEQPNREAHMETDALKTQDPMCEWVWTQMLPQLNPEMTPQPCQP